MLRFGCNTRSNNMYFTGNSEPPLRPATALVRNPVLRPCRHADGQNKAGSKLCDAATSSINVGSSSPLLVHRLRLALEALCRPVVQPWPDIGLIERAFREIHPLYGLTGAARNLQANTTCTSSMS
jgi:hypothetical protein